MDKFERAKHFIELYIDNTEYFLKKCSCDKRYIQGELEAFKIVRVMMGRIEKDDDTMPNDN